MNNIQPIVYNSFYEYIEKVLFDARISRYNSKYSNRIYSNYYHLFLIILKEQMNKSYREITKIVKQNKINRTLAYSKVPHYTTLQKVASKLDKFLLKRILFASARISKRYSGNLAIDATGFSTLNPSHYYHNRINAKRVKSFIKTTIVLDVDNRLIVNADTHSNNQHDNLDFLPLMQEILSKQKLNIHKIFADKGYDAKTNFKFAYENGIKVLIPVRNYPQTAKGYKEEGKVKCLTRKKAKRLFDETEYHQRSLVESINSAIKRKYGSFVRARASINQEKEAFWKLIVYNLNVVSRMISYLLRQLTKDFY